VPPDTDQQGWPDLETAGPARGVGGVATLGDMGPGYPGYLICVITGRRIYGHAVPCLCIFTRKLYFSFLQSLETYRKDSLQVIDSLHSSL
jgi:hypothetical protein